MIENEDSKLEVVYDLYANMLYRISYSILMSKEDAEDAVAETFIVYIKRNPVHIESEHTKAWLIRVVINKSRDIRRKRIIRSYISLSDTKEYAKEVDHSDTLLDLVHQLSDKYKIVILLYYYEEYSVQEISTILKISISNVKMRLLRARKVLKQLIEKERNDD